MRLSFQFALVVLIGLGAIYAGISNFYSPSTVFNTFYNIDVTHFNNDVRIAIESQVRLLSGMWIAAGVITLVCVRKFESNTNTLRLIFLGLALGAIGELFSVITLTGDVQAAIIKTAIQVGICISMELWRMYLVQQNKETLQQHV